MVRVIINGCSGRMGKVVASLIGNRKDMVVVAGVDVIESTQNFPLYSSLAAVKEKADVIIDFSNADSIASFLPTAQERSLAVVVATTALGEREDALLKEASKKIAVFKSGNMSLGINLMQQLAGSAAKFLGFGFDIEIIEKHHNQKKDAPSGTALMLADSINNALNNRLNYVCGREGKEAKREVNELGIHSVRGGTIVGEHQVIFAGEDEIITITHTSYSRSVFAAGAIAAAAFLVNQKPGLYNMKNLIEA